MQQLLAFLEKTLNISPERLAEILYKKTDDGTTTEDFRDEAISELLDLDKSRVASIKGDTKTAFDNGYKKAESSISEKWESTIREKFGVDSTDLRGEELVLAALEKQAGKSKLDDDSIKRHPLYLSLEKKYLEELKAAKEEGASALESFKAQYRADSIKSQAKAKAKEIVLAMKPVLEDDAQIAETRIADFLRDLDTFEFDENEGGGFMPLKGGKRYENEHFHPVEFEDLVKNIASRRFKFQVQDPKANGGNKNEPPGSGGGKKFQRPATEEEYLKQYNALSGDRDAQRALQDAWEEVQS